MTKTPEDFIELKKLKFLRLLVTALTVTMICGIITLVLVIVIKMPNFNDSTSITLPDEIILPKNKIAKTFSIGSTWYLVVTESDEILIYDKETNILYQTIKIK